MLDGMADEDMPSPAELIEVDDTRHMMDRWLASLTDKQRCVIELRFGLKDHERTTLEEVGEQLGVTRERVRQIQMEALRRLRKLLQKEGFTRETLQDR
jgi:RNA polymerase nonessential primary-like sigma factor